MIQVKGAQLVKFANGSVQFADLVVVEVKEADQSRSALYLICQLGRHALQSRKRTVNRRSG